MYRGVKKQMKVLKLEVITGLQEISGNKKKDLDKLKSLQQSL